MMLDTEGAQLDVTRGQLQQQGTESVRRFGGCCLLPHDIHAKGANMEESWLSHHLLTPP
jgi:hypothetical protein